MASEWVPYAALIVATGAAAASVASAWYNGRARKASEDAVQETRGKFIARLEILESWQATSSIDRTEFDEHGRRLTHLEASMGDFSTLLTDLRVQMATVVATTNSALEMSKLQFQTLDHKINNVRQMVERLTSANT